MPSSFILSIAPAGMKLQWVIDGRAVAHAEIVVDLRVCVHHSLDGAIAHRMCRELKVVPEGEERHLVQFAGIDVTHSPVVRVVDRIDLAHAPGLEHVRAAGEHTAVEIALGAADP